MDYATEIRRSERDARDLARMFARDRVSAVSAQVRDTVGDYRSAEVRASKARHEAHQWGQLAKVLLDFDGTLKAVLNDRAFITFDKEQKALIRRVRQDLKGRIHAACEEQEAQEALRDKLYREMEKLK